METVTKKTILVILILFFVLPIVPVALMHYLPVLRSHWAIQIPFILCFCLMEAAFLIQIVLPRIEAYFIARKAEA